MVDTALADATAVVALARSSCRLANLAALADASATVWLARPKVTCTLLPISRVLPPSSRTAGKALAEATAIVWLTRSSCRLANFAALAEALVTARLARPASLAALADATAML